MILSNSESLQEFRNDIRKMFDEGHFADARLVCFEHIDNGEDGEGERKRVEIPVHRAILAARSKFFAEAFANGGRDELEIQDFPASVIRMMLSYIYGDKIPDADEALYSLYKADKFYGLGIFEKDERIHSEMVINTGEQRQLMFDRKRKISDLTFYRDSSDIFPWIASIQMGMRKKWPMEEIGAEEKGKTIPHIDFELRLKPPRLGRQLMDAPLEKICIADLSFSILQSPGGEKLKTVKREGLSRGGAVWFNCFDCVELTTADGDDDPPSPNPFSVLCEATVCVAKRNNRDCVAANDLHSDFAALLDSGRFTDARIVCFEEDGMVKKRVPIPVHRCILAARSKFFNAAFSVEMREAETGEVEIPPETGFSPAIVRAMLCFVYTASIPRELEQSALIGLFKAAHFYQIEGLMEICSDLMEINTGNCCDALLHADLYDSERLKAKALTFIRENIDTVKTTEEWRNLMESAGEQLKMQLPLTVDNCFELLMLADTHGNEQLKRDVICFVKINKEEVKATDGWRRLMQGESEDIQRLKTQCAHWLGETPVTVENCCEMLRIGDAYDTCDDREMTQKALDFYWTNREAVQATDGWRQLMAAEGHEWLKMRMLIEEDGDSDSTTDSSDYDSDDD